MRGDPKRVTKPGIGDWLRSEAEVPVDCRDEPAAKRALRYSVSERSRARPLTTSCGCHHEGSGRRQASLSEILLTLLLVPQHLTATTDGQTPEPGFAAD